MTGNLDESRRKAREAYDRGSYDMAQKLYHPLAESGDADSQYYLGETLLLRAYDHVNAVGWWRKAAEQGFVMSQLSLSYMYQDGRGVKKNTFEAYKWFSLAHARHEKGEEALFSDADSVYRSLKLTAAQKKKADEWVKNWKPKT